MDGAQAVENILEHYGVRGMKWGIRKARGDRSSAVTVTQRPSSRLPGRRLKTKGGYGRSASEEAISSRVTGQVIRKSGVQALSNQELQAYTKRLNLEADAKRLDFNTSSRGRKFVKSLLGQTEKRYINDIANSEDVGKVGVAVATRIKATRGAKRLIKTGAKVTAVAAT